MNETPISLLLIEDDDIEAESVVRSLRKTEINSRLCRACDGYEGLQILRGNTTKRLEPSTIVLLDINMPRLNGLEFLKEVRSDPKLKSLIVFVLTTSDDDRDRTAAYESNVAGYILKSNTGRNHVRLFDLVTAYRKIIEMPTIQLHG